MPERTSSHDDDDEDEVVRTVVEMVAARSDVSPLELEPLASVIDPSLVARFATSEAVLPGSELRFRYADHEVRIHGDGTMVVECGD